jgi:hypothetical protein
MLFHFFFFKNEIIIDDVLTFSMIFMIISKYQHINIVFTVYVVLHVYSRFTLAIAQ